jgi:predicted ribosome quality control (RQC) complex YloA/Tae2 family protein
MEISKVLAEGETFVKNAEDTMSRPIINPDQLYVYDNQVEVIDTFLADTEDLQGQGPDLASLRDRLRGIKEQLEKKIIEVEAKAEGIEGPPEDVPADELVAAFEESGPELVAEADKALKKTITTVEKLKDWEDPLMGINSFLSDSEPLGGKGQLPQIRKELKERKAKLQERIQALLQEWRQRDLEGGEDDEGGG